MRFRFIGQLSRNGIFDRKQIISALSLLTWMTEKDTGHDSMFFLRPLVDGEVDVVQFSVETFPTAARLVGETGIVGAFISLAGLADDVLGRVTAHIERRPFVSPSEGLKKALLALQVGNRAEECQK